MLIDINDLNPGLTITIQGTEPWLAKLYGDFPLGDPKVSIVRGQLKLLRHDTGHITVRGTLQYDPVLPCSRCELGIRWPLDVPVEALYVPAEPGPPVRDRNLSAADLDAYDLHGHVIDVEGLINDVIQTALPTQALSLSEDASTCTQCGIDMSSSRVWSSGPSALGRVLSSVKLKKGNN